MELKYILDSLLKNEGTAICGLGYTIDNPRLWSPDNPFLYEATIRLKEKGQVEYSLLPLTAARDFKTLRGRFNELMSPEFTARLSSEDYYRDQSWLSDNELLTSTETDSAGEHRIAVIKGDKVPEPEIKVENGVLKIHAKERKTNVSLDFSELSHTPRILICCPKEELSSLNIHVDTGDVELAGISYNEALIETDTGDIVTAAVRGGKQSIRTDTGDVDLSGSFSESTVVKSDTGDIELTGICTGVIDITSDTGEFSFETKAAFADFGDIELKSDTGDISVEEGDNEIAEIDSAETIKVGVTGDLPPIDYVDEAGIPAGFNTAVLAEISRRTGKNIELVSIDSGARSLALSEGIVDVVFWSRISAPDQSIYDSLPEKRKMDATMIGLALAPYRHPDIDIPEGTITTDVYLHDIYITLYLKK